MEPITIFVAASIATIAGSTALAVRNRHVAATREQRVLGTIVAQTALDPFVFAEKMVDHIRNAPYPRPYDWETVRELAEKMIQWSWFSTGVTKGDLADSKYIYQNSKEQLAAIEAAQLTERERVVHTMYRVILPILYTGVLWHWVISDKTPSNNAYDFEGHTSALVNYHGDDGIDRAMKEKGIPREQATRDALAAIGLWFAMFLINPETSTASADVQYGFLGSSIPVPWRYPGNPTSTRIDLEPRPLALRFRLTPLQQRQALTDLFYFVGGIGGGGDQERLDGLFRAATSSGNDPLAMQEDNLKLANVIADAAQAGYKWIAAPAEAGVGAWMALAVKLWSFYAAAFTAGAGTAIVASATALKEILTQTAAKILISIFGESAAGYAWIAAAAATSAIAGSVSAGITAAMRAVWVGVGLEDPPKPPTEAQIAPIVLAVNDGQYLKAYTLAKKL